MFFSCSQSLPSDLSQKIKSCFVGQKKDRTLTVLLLLKEVVDVRWLVCGCQPVILLYHLACYLIPTKRLSAAPRSHHAGTPTPPPPHWAHPALIEHVVQKPPVPGITLDPSYSPSLPPTDWETRWEGMA